MARERAPLLETVGRYYSEKLEAHGPTPAGVDWNGRESQELRFEQLLRVVGPGPFTIADVGCGFGSLVDYLERRGGAYEYLGVDVSESMIAKARELHGARANCSFVAGTRIPRAVDYCVASGIFNVRLAAGDAEWNAHILRTLDDIDAASRRGFAFNCLTSYSDAERMRDYLYYADPRALFDHCKRRYARDVALLHDYGLYEFTMLVRKG